MILRTRRLSPIPVLSCKVSLMAWLVLAGATSAAAQVPGGLGRAEQAWYALVVGRTPPPAGGDDIGARWRWLAGDLADLREAEATDPEAAAARYAALPTDADPELAQLVAERLAFLALAAQRAADARPLVERSLALADRLGLPLAGLRAHLDLGRALIQTREVTAADAHLARVDTSALAPPAWRADAALARSVVARLSMDLDTALRLRERAYDLYTEAGSLAGRARALHYIGTTHAMQGELSRAMVRLQHAEELARESGSDDVLAGCLGDQAGIRYLTGDLERARAQYHEAADLASDPRHRGWYLTNLASILAHEGRHDEALPRYDEALEMVRATGDRRTESTILLAMGLSRCAVGEVARGLAELDRALAHADEYGLPLDAARALEVKGHALIDEGRLAEAEPLLRDAVARADQLAYFDLQEWARAGLAEIARQRGRYPEAVEHLEAAIAVAEQVRRRSGGSPDVQRGYFSQASHAFDALVQVLGELHLQDPTAGHDVRAWDVAQRGRARSLLDLMAEAEVDLRMRADAGFREREQTILDGIAAVEERRLASPDSAEALAAQVRRLEGQLLVLEAELRDADPRYAELRYPQPVSLARLRGQVLAPGEAVLEYLSGFLPLLRDPSLTGGEASWYVPAARALAAAILDPVLPSLATIERLIVVPDGILHYLPLASLPTRGTTATTYAGVPWLAADLEVVRTPSASALARLRSAAPLDAGASPLLLIADPLLPTGATAGVFVRAAGVADLSPAPGAAMEQEHLIDLYGRRARWFSGAQATAARLATEPSGGAWRTVHLATHGIVNEQRPRYSGLLLAPGDGDDGFLDLPAIFALDLPCDQVVLSACSSALGEHVDGEGLVGFVHGFLYAGAHSVVASLWDVEGDGTARFMAEYHGRLARGGGGASRAAALAQARRTLSADPGATSGGVPLAHPAIWAAFVAIGDAR